MDHNIDPSISLHVLFGNQNHGRSSTSTVDSSPRDQSQLPHAIEEETSDEADELPLDAVMHLKNFVAQHEQSLPDEPDNSDLTLMSFAHLNPSSSSGLEAAAAVAAAAAATASASATSASRESHLRLSFEDKSRASQTTSPLVHYNPQEPAQRLGRPRRHITSTLPVPLDSSSKNLNKAVISRFRFDGQPLVGHGSRGGKTPMATPRGLVTSVRRPSQKKQSQLNFAVKKPSSKEELPALSPIDTDELISRIVAENNNMETGDMTDPMLADEPKPEDPTKQKSLKVTLTLKRKPEAPQYKSRKKQKTIASLCKVSRTTIVSTRSKLSRQLPGPLVGLCYDLYDENFMNAPQNASCNTELLALGFPVKAAPYAKEIMYIITFMQQFDRILGVDDIGPAEIEYGLGLSQPPTSTSADEAGVSPQMKELFNRILSLVLNRKKPIQGHSKSAYQELVALCGTLGPPREWLASSAPVAQDATSPNDSDLDLVDPSRPDIPIEEPKLPQTIKMSRNPLLLPGFDMIGIDAITSPFDRLILLRTMLQWSLVASESVKLFMAQSIQSQDLPGDKETYYGARSILKGYKDAYDTKALAEAKLAKRDDDVKYYDPTLNPLDHSFRIRLVQDVIGDAGFHVGRFFLCRMASETNGGLSSIRKMTLAWSGPARASLPSFKLYVQDVYSMLRGSLAVDGVEFDKHGNEVHPKIPKQHWWYEVASNGTELQSFLDHLGKRLGVTPSDENESFIIPSNSPLYKACFPMYEYLYGLLPLIHKQEALDMTELRRSKLKTVNYNEPSVYENIAGANDDSDYEEEYIEEGGVHSDQDDDAYID